MDVLNRPEAEIPIFVIDGNQSLTWMEIVDKINSFMSQSSWMGNSLDALDDMLYGGYGTPDQFVIIWKNWETSRVAFGYEATKAFYSNAPDFEQLYAAGHIKNLFETLVEIFRGHDTIELRLE